MTAQQIESLKLGIAPIDDRTVIIIESGLEWVQKNTTLEFDKENDEELKALPSCVRLFLIKYFDVNMLSVGVSSESIDGLSQSFSQSKKEDLIWDSAYSTLGDYMNSAIQFIPAQRRFI